MSRLQDIEDALRRINPAQFQELCDSFLILRNKNYSTFSRVGSQSGKQKTIKGTPDSLLLLPSGKYIFVEYSTNSTSGFTKLSADVSKCIDSTKTGIPVNQISEIILCINFNLKPEEIQKLKNQLDNTRISLSIYSLDVLALELHLNHRDLCHIYLGLPLDTGQVVSIERFIDEYNRSSKGVATPLDNTFLHREKELNDLSEEISKNDYVVLTGPAGIGKTKLALEAIKQYVVQDDTYSAFCLSYKNHTLFDDLQLYLKKDKNYILFVDDANRIDAFNQITGFYKENRKGQLKIIITVRDYALHEILNLTHGLNLSRIDLEKLTDEQIKDIIAAQPLEITNPVYQEKILAIADGNPRIAIMTSLLAKAKQNIQVLYDVSDLFEKYFSTFVKDNVEIEQSINIKTLGLIAFFYTIPYKNREITEPILTKFGLTYHDFVDSIDALDKLELVEVQYEHVKIPEQNLSVFFFYKAFIKEERLSFEILLTDYFESNSRRFEDCIIPANNTFGPENVMDKLKPHLQNHWNKIKNDEFKAYKFLSTFWFYLNNQALEFVYEKVNSLPPVITNDYRTEYKDNDFAFDKDDTIELLGDFFRYPTEDLSNAIELAFEYVRRKPESFPELLHKIRQDLTFTGEDANSSYYRQNTLFDILIKGLDKNDLLYVTAFYELSKTFMNVMYRYTRSGRKHTLTIYTLKLPNTPPIHKFRERIWEKVNEKFTTHPLKSLDFLESHSSMHPDVVKKIMEFDVPFVLDIIEKHLSKDSFEHCLYVQNQIRWFKRSSMKNPRFELLLRTFQNPTYNLFLKIDWDRFRDKEIYDFDNYQQYEELKQKEIRKSFIFKSKVEVEKFYEQFAYLKRISKNQWNYNKTLDYIIDENCSKNFEIGCAILEEVILKNNEIDLIPAVAFNNQLTESSKSTTIWNIITKTPFKHCFIWQLSYYDHLDQSQITYDHAQRIIKTINDLDEPVSLFFGRFKKYLEVDPKILEKLLQAIVLKNEKSANIVQVWQDPFTDLFDYLGQDIELIKKGYLQQDKLQQHFDFDGKGLNNILRKDPSFLKDYVNSLYRPERYQFKSREDLGCIWDVEEIEKEIWEVFDMVISKELYIGISDHFCNAFFKSIPQNSKERAEKFLLDYAKENSSDSDKVNVVIDIARHTMKHIYEKLVLQHLTLNQDVKVFEKVKWRGSGGTYSGDVIIGDLQAAEWRNLLALVEKAELGLSAIPIKKYINDQIEGSLKYAESERQRRFIERY